MMTIELKQTLLPLLFGAAACALMGCAGESAPATAGTAVPLDPHEAVSQLEGAVFPLGDPNTGYAQYFTGQSYLYPIQKEMVNVANVTFAPGTINYWHRHHGSCQVLASVAGRGYYQIWGQDPVELHPGDSVTIPENVKHWHGAQHEGYFQHLSIMKEGASTEWLEPVDEAEYQKLK